MVDSSKLEDVRSLRSFIDDNEDLERLEAILDRFNLFESLGLVRHEIRHSAFIRWLLDPAETHGLGDYWLRQFLRRVVKQGDGDTFSLFDLDDWSLDQVDVHKEWRNIDILIHDVRNRFVCVIENKVDSGEGAGQLQRYRRIVEREFDGYQKAFVFLTISGDAPSDVTYVPMSYGDLVDVIENALKRRESQLNEEIRLFVQQYLEMVRRRIVEDSDVQQLSRRIYQNHRRALDLIFEHRPDRAAEISDAIQSYIKRRDDLISTYNTKTYMKFLPRHLDLPELRHEGNGILVWLLENKGSKIQFRLELQPGPEDMRAQIYEKARRLPRIFGKPKSRLAPKYHTFLSETWITRKEYDELNVEDIRQKIGARIEGFEAKSLEIANALKELT